ncbi:Crp/Fnr family transcriptional regulator [Roseateles sp. BYS180W]|uniref:Crp/Fnr family transcriptional regulator n=1 Tax=Roseateles rivi TaxID=3299028 RepID=A0ABW7FRY6_9BURK
MECSASLETCASAYPDQPALGMWQGLLPGVGAHLLGELQARAVVRHVEPGALILRHSQTQPDVLALLQGQAGVGELRSTEAPVLERSVRGPQWLNLASAWLHQASAQDIWAQSSAQLLALPVLALRHVLRRQPELADALLQAMARQVTELSGLTHEFMRLDAEKRLAAWLLRRAGGLPSLALGERKRDIAAQLAIAPETLSRLMKQLKLKGLIDMQGYTVHVLRPEGLAALAQC